MLIAAEPPLAPLNPGKPIPAQQLPPVLPLVVDPFQVPGLPDEAPDFEIPEQPPQQRIERLTSQLVTPTGQPDVSGPIDPQTGYILEHGCEAPLQPKLMKLFQDRNPMVRQLAAEALSRNDKLPRAVIAAAAPLLLDPNSAVREAAVKGLGEQAAAPQGAVNQLIVALHDPEDGIAINAAGLLGKLGADGAAAAPVLLAMISDEDRGDAALEALGGIGAAARWTAPQLIGLLENEAEIDPNLVTTLGKVGAAEGLQKALLKKLKDAPHDMAVINALGMVQPTSDAVVDALIAATKDSDDNVCESATVALGQAHPTNERIVAALAEKLKSKRDEERLAAISALGQIEPKLPSAIPLVVVALHDRQESVRTYAEESLEGFTLPIEVRLKAFLPAALRNGWGPEKVGWNTAAEVANGLPLLTALSKNPRENEAVRAGAVMMAWKCDPAPQAGVKALSLALLSDAATPHDVATQAAIGLVDLGEPMGEQNPRLADVLLKAAKESPSSNIRIAAALRLAKLNHAAGVEELIKAMEDSDEEAASNAINSVSQLPAAQIGKVLPALCRMVKDPNSPHITEAAATLEAMGESAAPSIPTLLEVIGSGAEHMDGVAQALGKIVQAKPAEAGHAVSALAALLQSPTTDVRRVALVGLGSLPPAAAAARVPEIADRLADDDEEVRIAAIDALKEIGPGASKVTAALVKVLDTSAGEEDRAHVLQALAAIQGDARLVVPAATRFLDDQELSDSAIEVLCHLGPGAKAGVPALTQLLHQPWARHRTAAAEALGKIGADAKASIPELTKVQRGDPDEQVRAAATAAIGVIAPQQASQLGAKQVR
ncbi:MAG: HEAT repeat domain-containing protein [Planctomycetia bacterium]|nr:HEAT repeat domain-containing protein [Planctomycetia bacterium]